ncbi:MAG: hypothetical protein ABFE07_15815 [Armatimonadia bacterium]
MNYVHLVILACIAMAIVIGIVYQSLAYARGRLLISRRQFVLRLINGLLLLATIALIFYVPFLMQRAPDVRLLLAYWGILTLLPLIVVVLAFLDLRELSRTRHRHQAELYRNLANLEQELRSKETGPRS